MPMMNGFEASKIIV